MAGAVRRLLGAGALVWSLAIACGDAASDNLGGPKTGGTGGADASAGSGGNDASTGGTTTGGAAGSAAAGGSAGVTGNGGAAGNAGAAGSAGAAGNGGAAGSGGVAGSAGAAGSGGATDGGITDGGGILTDTDGDKIPDVADPFPNDPTKPKASVPEFVYPHTASTLFKMSVKNYAITTVGVFGLGAFFGSMTDLAIDQYGVLYGVTFDDLFTCDADTAVCYHLANLPQSFNGLTMVPPGVLDPVLDVLIGIAITGDWYKITLNGSGSANITLLGKYGPPYSSSGDAFSIENVGTFAAVDKGGQASDVIVSVDPKNGAILSEIGPVTGYTALYGLAGWEGVVFGFDETGAVLKIDTTTGTASVITTTNNFWWGAGVATRIQQP